MLGAQNAQSEDDFRGGSRPLPGRYHSVVKVAEEKTNGKTGNQQVEVTFEVLAGTMPGQEGKEMIGYFVVTEKNIKQLQCLATVLGLLRPGQSDTDIDFAVSRGRQLVIEVIEDVYEGKKREKLAYMGFWSVNHRDVADVPKNAEAMAYLSQQSAAVATAAAPSTIGAPVTSPGATQSAGGKWAGI
jgi:hypothetical protein